MQRLWKDQTEVAVKDWTSARELFMLRCRSKNVSEQTLAWYGTILGGFLRFVDRIGAMNVYEAHGRFSPMDRLLTPASPNRAVLIQP